MVGPLLARFRIHSWSQTGTKTSIGRSTVVFGDGLKCLKEFEVNWGRTPGVGGCQGGNFYVSELGPVRLDV